VTARYVIFIQGATSSSSEGLSSVAIGGAVGGALIILVIIIAVLLVLLYMMQSHQKRSRPTTVGVSTSIGKASKISMLLQIIYQIAR